MSKERDQDIVWAAELALVKFLHEVTFANLFASLPVDQRDELVQRFRDALKNKPSFLTGNLEAGSAVSAVSEMTELLGNRFLDNALARSDELR